MSVHVQPTTDRARWVGHWENKEAKSSNRVWLPRLEIKTARRIDLRRAVSRLVRASYANHEAKLSQFKRATLFRVRRRAIARTYCRIGSYGVQIQSPLSGFVSLVRVLIGELWTVMQTKPSSVNKSGSSPLRAVVPFFVGGSGLPPPGPSYPCPRFSSMAP